MSLFLAPIHSWLFNKIRLYEELEQNVIKSHLEILGEDVNNIVNVNDMIIKGKNIGNTKIYIKVKEIHSPNLITLTIEVK